MKLRKRSTWRGVIMRSVLGRRDLTSRDWAVIALVCQGCTNAQIAAATQTAEPLVENQLRAIFDKTGCWNRTEIALWYLKMGLEEERRLCDRREVNSKIGDERRKDDRRRPPRRSKRADEQHEINLDE